MRYMDTRYLHCLGSLLTLDVVAKGFALALDVPQVSPGTITFSIKNAGAIPHNFAIQGNGVDQKTTLLKPGETASLTVDLQPGTYTSRCTVHFHNLLGMKGALTVTGSQPSGPDRKHHGSGFVSAQSRARE
jgi:plastocyanin